MHHRSSLGLFNRLRNGEVTAECDRVSAYLDDKALRKRTKELARAGVRGCRFVFYGNPSPCSHAVKPPAGPLDFQELFGNSNPVRLEVCSGHGDWLVSRASENPDVNWIALEMRPDRVHLIWSKMVLAGLTNVAILGGSALEMLTWHVPNASLDQVYVNFPDPPVWHGSPMRLVDEPFLTAVHRALQPGHDLILVTDDAAYAKIMLRQLERVPTLFASALEAAYAAELPEDYGTSYFDRMWTNGNHNHRYYIRQRRQGA
jgi:tRNA (guanine-N(7)-)-methyltransferase